ncbi:MAG: phosphatase PAP2 family protein [Gemmatimonadaceae bacterium]
MKPNRTALAWLTLATLSSSAIAQTPMQGDSVHASKTLFTYRDAALAGGFVALTFAMFPLDRSMARRLQDSSTQASHFFKTTSKDVQYIASPGAVVIGVGMYGVGRIAGWKDVEDLGLHGTEAVLLASAATTLLKGVAGRARPYQTGDTSAHDFKFGRGFGDANYQSFPSGHATAAFAAAAAVTSESQRWWPHKTWLVAPVMYGGATLVGLSRMYNNAHWASDVALGAAIGTFAGIKVERYSHGHSNNLIDRIFLGMRAGPTVDGGAQVGFSFDR